MKSVILTSQPGEHGYTPEMRDLAVPKAGPGELVIELGACGLCGTDLEKISGDYTASMPVIGHEVVGTVHKVGIGALGFEVGDRVFPHHHVPDYHCRLCKSGNETMCDRYRSSNLDPGGFSEYFRVPRWNVEKGGVLKLPRTMTFEVASLIEPLACVVRSVAKCRVGPRDSVLVVGAGPVGMMHAFLLRETAAEVMISDVSEERLDFAEREKAGKVMDAKFDVPQQVRSETAGAGADVAMVASGSKAAIIQGLRSVRKGGRVCIFGVPAKGTVLDYDISELYNSEQEILTSYGAAEKDTMLALKVLSSRDHEFGSLVTHRFPLKDFSKAVEAASGRKTLKVVMTP